MYFLTWVWGALTGFLPFLVNDDDDVDDDGDEDDDDDDDDDDGDALGTSLPEHVNLLGSATSKGKLAEGKNHQR